MGGVCLQSVNTGHRVNTGRRQQRPPTLASQPKLTTLPCPPPPCFPRCSFSPLCTDPTTLKTGVAEGRANVIALARALFGAELPALRGLDGEKGGDWLS